MQSSSAGLQAQKNDVRMKKLLEEAATSLADTSEVLGRELSETRRELAARKCSNTELEGKLGSAERQIAILEEALRQREVESRAAHENGFASAEKLAALRKRLEREKAAAVQEAEAKWQERHDNFKRESVAVLAQSASSLEAAEEEIKQLKEKLAATEAGVLKEQQQHIDKLARDQARIQEEQRATAAQHDATRRELESLTETLKTELNNLRQNYEREQRKAQARAAAAEAEVTNLHVVLATERLHAERAQQEAKLLAAQLEQNRGRLAMALAARDRADAECAAAKAERVAAERDREAAEKVLADVVVQLDELERQQEAPPPLPEPQAQALLMPPSEATDEGPGAWDSQEQPPHAGEAAAAPQRLSRDPRLSTRTLAPAGLRPADAPPADDGWAVDDSYTSALPDLLDQADAAPGAVESPALPAEGLHALTTEPGPSAGGPQAEAKCWLCQKGGSRQFRDLGPLLHLAINDKGTEMKWLHRQCLLWSPEVSEGRGSELVNVPKAVFRGRHINCKVCGNNGASLGCQVKSCRNSYHLPCALAKGCYLDDWRVWCPKHAPHIPNRVTAGPFSGMDLDLLRQDVESGSAEASGKKGGSRSQSAQGADAAPAAAARAASGTAVRRKASSQPSSASAATIEAPPKPGTASATSLKEAAIEQDPLRKASSQPAQSAAATAEAPTSTPADAKKQLVSAEANRRKAATQKAVSTAGTTTEAPTAAPESAPAASRKAEPRASPRRKADSQPASVSAGAETATHHHAPQQKAASQPSDVATGDNPASEHEVETAEAAVDTVEAAPALAEVAPAVQAEGSEPVAMQGLQLGRRKKRKGNPVAAQPSMPVVPAQLPPIRTPTKVRKVRRQLKPGSKAKAQPAAQPAIELEPHQAPSSEPGQAVGNEPLQATGDGSNQTAAVEEPDQATDESPVEETDQAMDEEPDEAPASQPVPEQNSQVMSALGRSTGAIASMLGLQRWSRLAPKAAKQTAVLLAARGRHDGSSQGTASASSAPSAAALVSSAAAPSSSAGAPSSSAGAPTSPTALPVSPLADRSGFVGRLMDCLAEQEANPAVVPSLHLYQRKEAKRLEWGASSALPRIPDVPRTAAPKPLPPEQPLAPAAGAKKAAAAGEPPTGTSASVMKLAADGRTGGIACGVPLPGTGALARKGGRPKKAAAAIVPPADAGLAAEARSAAAPGEGGPAADTHARAAPHSAPATPGGGKMRPARNRKAPERLASMPEGPQWLGSKTKRMAQQALMENGVKSELAQGQARGQKRPAPPEVSEAAKQEAQTDGQHARPAKKACNEPVGSPGSSRELRALQSAAAGLEALSNSKQGFRYTTRLASSSPEPQQPSAPKAAGPNPAKFGKCGTAGTRTGITPINPNTGNGGSSSDAAACDDKAEVLRDLMIRRRAAVRMYNVELRKDSSIIKVLALSADEIAAIVQRMRVQATLP
ncbi:g11886 [Coccomyxa elongata]